jgi:hypothetical protein
MLTSRSAPGPHPQEAAVQEFAVIPSLVFHDPRITARAMGVLGHMTTLDPGTAVTERQICEKFRDGKTALRNGIFELVEVGYMRRFHERKADGTWQPITYRLVDDPFGPLMFSGPHQRTWHE